MADRHDDVDSWLSERIEPLPPPPGTFELIKRRARRRKYRRLVFTATAAAVIVAAAVTVPQVVTLPVLSPATSGVQAGRPSSGGRTGGGSPASSSSARSTGPAVTTGPGPVPANFRPTSVTFVGTGTGWVIGQAGTPGHCATVYCTSVARTDNAGKTWTGVPAPLTGAPDGATGVSQIRFLNTDDGWAFGPELFATHDGGQTWTAVNTHGLRVTDLETVGNRAYGVFASCGYSSPASPASGAGWTRVGPSTSGLTDGGQLGAASLVLTGTRGYLLAPDRTLYAGPVRADTPWQPVSRVPCVFGPAVPSGQPGGALLGAVNDTNLVFACLPPAVPGSLPGGLQKKLMFRSADGGSSWQEIAVAPAAGIASSLAASPAGTVVLGTNQGIDLLPAGSTATAWQTATLAGSGPADGFSYVGMTTDYQGIALPADPASGTVWFTFDGGHSWQPSHLDGS